MKNMLWTLTFAGSLLGVGMLSACGSAEDACSTDNDCKGARICQDGDCVEPADSNNTNNANTNNTNTNNENTNNSNTNNSNNSNNNATCAQTCAKATSCDPTLTKDECESGCNANVNQATRNCITNAPTCADAEACFGNANNANNASSGIGASCSINEDCDSKYCKKPAGSFEGKCATNDFGDMCKTDNDCEYGACLYRDLENDIFGYCTNTCSSFTDCPTFWKCGEVGNAGGKYCIQD